MAKITSVEPLKEEEYVKIYGTFVAGSTEYIEIRGLFIPIIKSFNGINIDVMSIGAGTGHLENDLIKNFGLNLQSFLAVEPNADHVEKLRMTSTEWNNVDITIDQRPFDEGYETKKRFDVVLMCHCMYFFANPIQCMLNAKSFLKPNGKLVIFCHTQQGGYELYSEMRKNVSFTQRPLGDQSVEINIFRQALEQRGIKHEFKEAASAVDVTEFVNKSDCPTANDVITFFLQTHYDSLNDDLQKRIYQMVKERVFADDKSRQMFPHPCGMIVCYG